MKEKREGALSSWVKNTKSDILICFWNETFFKTSLHCNAVFFYTFPDTQHKTMICMGHSCYSLTRKHPFPHIVLPLNLYAIWSPYIYCHLILIPITIGVPLYPTIKTQSIKRNNKVRTLMSPSKMKLITILACLIFISCMSEVMILSISALESFSTLEHQGSKLSNRLMQEQDQVHGKN